MLGRTLQQKCDFSTEKCQIWAQLARAGKAYCKNRKKTNVGMQMNSMTNNFCTIGVVRPIHQ